MSDFVFNVAKGRVVEFYHRVENADPANAALIVVPLSATETEANLQDLDDLESVLQVATEQTGSNWERKTLTASDLTSPSPNDTDNRYDVALPQLTWTAPAEENDVVALLVCYDGNTTTGDDGDVIPLTHHDFAVTADGSDVILNAGDFFRAS